MKDRAYEIAIIPKYDGYYRGFTSMVYKFFNKKTQSGTRENMNGEELQAKNYINQLLKNSKEGKFLPG